jgi:predicted anti-sigma-YlaC factor YlaD
MDTKHSAIDVSRVPERFVLNRWVRFALAWAAVLLIAWNVVAMFAAGSGSSIHLERHRAAFDVALGVAFLFVVWRPDRAYGMVPFAATFTFALSISAIIDLVNGASTPLRESAHLVEISGLGLLWVLGLAVGPGGKRTRLHTGSSADS